jgi:S1-C subfamily serine protease
MKKLLTVAFLIINFIQTYSQLNPENFILTDNGKCKIYDPNYIAGKTYTWNGEIKDNLADGGNVCMIYINDSLVETIEANFEKGVAQGTGYIKRDNKVITGSFVDGMIMGQGTIKDDQGYEYSGNLINGIGHGYGKITYNTGSTFEGLINNDLFWTGKYINLKDEVSYYYQQEKVEELPIFKAYTPELNKTLTEYFDENLDRCDKSVAQYFRKITYEAPNKPKGKIKDFFIDGNLMGEYECWYVDYTDDNLKFQKSGIVNYYYSDGTPYSIYEYNEKNSLCGESKWFHGNGNLKEIASYNEFGLLDGDRYIYDEYGNLTTAYYYDNGLLEDDGYFSIDENGFWTAHYPANFERDKENWELYDDLSYAYVLNDRLYIINEKDGVYSKNNFIGVDQNKNHTIYCSSVIDKVEDLTLCFDYLDNNNCAFFTITPKKIIIERIINGESNILYVAKNKIKKGYNDFYIANFNGYLTFYLNNNAVYECRTWEYTGAYGAIYVGGKASLLIDQFEAAIYFNDEESQGFNNFVANGGSKAIENNSSSWDASGSGFFISKDGYIATNYHVIEDASRIEIDYNENGEKQTYEARVVLSDKINDLAILEIADENFEGFETLPYELNYSVQDVGADVFTLGYPLADVLGDEIKYTNGAISSKTGIDGDITVYQISVPIQPGNSGGPLFNAQGNVVGITSSRLNKEMFESENVNYAIKLSYLKNLIDVLPKQIENNSVNKIKDLPITEKIKTLQDFIPIIHVKLK